MNSDNSPTMKGVTSDPTTIYELTDPVMKGTIELCTLGQLPSMIVTHDALKDAATKYGSKSHSYSVPKRK